MPAAGAFAQLAAPPAPPTAPVLWWVARASGFLAYAALLAGMLLGVLVSVRVHTPLLGKRTLLQLHEQSLVAAVVAAGIHILAVAGHEAVATDAPSIVATLPGTLGLVAFLGLGILAISRWLRGRLNQLAFRRVHMLSYAVCGAGVAHAALAGGAGVDAPLRVLYLLGGALIALLIAVRAAPPLLRHIGLRAPAPLPRARWRRALRGKRRGARTAPDDRHQRPAA